MLDAGGWGELEYGKLGKNRFVICWGWSLRRKGDHSRFPATELRGETCGMTSGRADREG